jgi:hypothetical protein
VFARPTPQLIAEREGLERLLKDGGVKP